MQKLIGFVAAFALVATAMPVSAEGSLYERNYDLLVNLLPDGAVIEVQIWENGEQVTQLWTAEQFADFRASKATLMGKDYALGAEGLPSGPGGFQAVGDVWADIWNDPYTANVETGRGNAREVAVDDKFWLYGGTGSNVGIFEAPGGCYLGFICSSLYGWTYPQGPSGDAANVYSAGSGVFFHFGAPFGSSGFYDGVGLSDQ